MALFRNASGHHETVKELKRLIKAMNDHITASILNISRLDREVQELKLAVFGCKFASGFPPAISEPEPRAVELDIE